jgi:hypothetical protein
LKAWTSAVRDVSRGRQRPRSPAPGLRDLRLQILNDKAGRKIEISATVSQPVADAFEKQ